MDNWRVEITEHEVIIRIPCDVSNDPSLTRRQTEVLKLVREMMANKEIANKLNLSIRTVKLHVSALLRAFKVQTRHDL